MSVPDLIRQRDAEELDRGEQGVLALLDMAGVRLEDFMKPKSHEHLIRDLENASNSIGDEGLQPSSAAMPVILTPWCRYRCRSQSGSASWYRRHWLRPGDRMPAALTELRRVCSRHSSCARGGGRELTPRSST